MEKPHGVSLEDGSPDTKWEKGTTSGKELSSCGSTSGPTSSTTTSVGGRIEEKMEVDDPLLLPSLASLPSSSSITITKASVAQQRPSQSPSSSSTPCSITVPTSHPSVSKAALSASSCESISSANRAVLGPDMMPTIPLVPVQVPCGRGSIVSLPRMRGRPKGMPLSPSRSGNIHIRRGMKIRRIGLRGRGGRRLSHSMSLEERGGVVGEDSPLPLDDEAYVQDDMFMAPTYQDRWAGRVCSLCCLGEQSQLGQGDLIRHDPTPGYILPEKIASPSETNTQESLLSKKLKATQVSLKEKGKSPRKQVGEILPEPVDEISLVGHTELPSISTLFEPTGHCYVHYMCALWSSSVELTNDDTITHVDRAVVAGASQRCVHCKKFGATLLCKAPSCQLHYHFPCAMSAGALMDLKSVAFVCPSHTDKSCDIVDVACVVCENLSPESSLLFCCSCGNHYHGLCLKQVISPTPVMRAGWQCPDCKTCQMCRQPSEEMVCGICDKAYHVMCARPFGLSLCRTGWKCKTCRVCGDCGSRTPGNGLSSRWHSNFTVCDSCYQLRNKGFACPICHKAYRAIAQKSMAMCTKCQRHVHSECDADADLSIIQAKRNSDHSYEYVCTSCSSVIPSPNQSPQTTLEDSCDGPQDSSINSDDSNDTDLTSEGKSEDLSTVKPQSNFLSKGKPLGLAKRGFPSKLRGGAGEKYSMGKKTFSGSKKRGQAIPVRRGRGNGRGYRGYFNYQNAMETHQSAGKEEGEENKLILVSAKDEFCLQQDVCAMCGAFGQDQEGRLIACAQCGQCYHPFCANVKVTKVVLQKGWRCLDCTVCEGCGERNDEARLVLCEDCDISYHIYCMNPPLDHVPSGVWRCKWCAICIHCGATDPGANSSWQQNYSMCGPCMSMTQCPVCDEPYSDGELILQCSNCERWLHASDDMIHTEEEAERCASKGYLCLICRPQDAQPPHLLPHTPPVRTARIITTAVVTSTTSSSPVRSQSPTDMMTKVTSKAQFWMDGICLSECGMFQIKTMTLEPQKKSSITHHRNPKAVRTSRGPSIDSTGSRDIDDDDDEDDENKLDTEEPRHWVYGMKEGTILPAKEDGTPPDLPDGFYTLPGLEPGTYTLRKRRYRNIKTLGIGGFQVRARGKKDEEKAREEALLDPQVLELRRKRSNWRTKKKIKLLEKFPSYIQEAFFGRNLMDTSNLEEEMKQISGLDEEIDEDVLELQKAKSAITLSKDELQLVQAAQNKQHGHDRLVESCLQDTKYLAPHQIKSEDMGDVKKRERKDTDDKKDRGHKEEDMAEEDENNEAIDAIFAQGGDITDIFMHDIISGSMKDDDANLTGDEDISQDTIDIPSGSGSGTKLTDILGPGFNLDDVADIMQNLPEDGAEDSQDSSLSTTVPPASSLGAVEGEGSACADSERSVSSTPTESPATQTSSNLPVSKESLVPPTPPGPVTLPAASTLRPNQPPVAPLGSLPLPVAGPPVPPVQTVSGVSSVPLPCTPVSLSNVVQCPSPIPSIKSPATLTNPVALTSPVTHQNPSALPSTLPSPATRAPSAPQSLSSPLPRPDSQTSSHGFCPTPTTFSPANKPPTPTIPEPPKLWSSNDSQSQSLSLEEDESLGDKATKAAVLYVNVHKPNLKTDFPAVADRERQIKRIWKNLKDTEQKKMLIQRARENKKEYYKNKQFRTGRVIIPQGSSARDTPGSSSPPPLSPLSVESSSTPQPPLSPPSGTQGLNSPLVSSCSLQLVSSENRTSCASDDTSESYSVVSSATTMKVAGVQTSPPGSFNPSGLNPARPSLSRLPDPPRAELPLANPSSPPDPDQHIRVLTPLEIMRTLPVLHQDAFPSPTTTTTTSVTTTTTITTTTEQQRALKSNENLESSGTSGTGSTPGNVNEGGNIELSPVTTPHASPRTPLPSLTPPRPMVISQRPQMPLGAPSRQVVPHNMIRGPIAHSQGGSNETYTMSPGTSHPNKPVESFTHPSTPTPQTSPLPSPTNDPYSRIPPSPRPSSDVYSLPPGTPRPTSTDPYAMPPPTPRSLDPYATQPSTPRPMTSEQFTCSTPTESFSQPPASPYVQAPPTPRPHEDIYGQAPTPSPQGGVPGDPVRQQHLRELLQRPPWSEGSGGHAGGIPQPMTSPTGHSGEFRPPLPPAAQIANVRMRPILAPGQPTMMIPQSGQMDHRFRMIFQRNLPQQPPQRQVAPNGRSSVDAFTHVPHQRPPQQYLSAAGPGVRPGLTNVVRGPATNLIVSQGMGSPHLPPGSAVRVPVLSPTHLPQSTAHQLVPVPHSQPHHPPHPQSPNLQQSHPQPPHSQQPHIPQADPRLPHPQLSNPQQSHSQQPTHTQPRHPQAPHPQPPHSEPSHSQPSHTQPPHTQPPHTQPPHPPLSHQQEAQPSQQQQSESELPEAVTRELEQLEEEQQQQQQHHPAPQPPPQPVAPTHSSAQGDDLEDLAPSDLTTMEDDDLLGMGGDFNALLEFADGEEEDNEKLPSNLFDDLDADEEERRKKERGREVVSGPRGPPKGKVGVPGVGSPSAGPLSHPQPTVAPSQGSQHHTTGSVTLDCGAQPQGPHPASSMNSTIQQRPGLPPGPTVGPVRLSMTSSPQQQPVQPQMAPQITQTTPRIAGVVTRMLGPRPGLQRQPAAPPPPYPGHPPPPYPRSQEQPLLIEDLLEQEKLEQMKQQKASHQQDPIGPVDLNLSDVEYEKLKADVLSVGNPAAGLTSVPGGQVMNNNGVRQPFQRVAGPPTPTSTQSPQQVPGPAQPMTRPVRPQGDPGMHPALLQAVGSRGTGSSTPGTVNIKTLPPPPLPPDNPQTDAERQQQSQYEHWLAQQHNLITTQQRYYEAEITKLRKQRKNLNSRLRTLKKSGQGLNEHDAAELARVQREASAIQRHLEQCRKSARQHAMTMQEYNNKKRNRPPHIMNTQGGVMNTSQGTMMTGSSPVGPAGSSPMHSTPQSPLMSPSPSSQPGMGLSPMVPSPHTPVASPNPTIVPQHSPHAMVVPGPHPSPGESPFSPQTRMPSPGGGYPDQGPRAVYQGASQGMTHHMMAPQMRVRMPVHSPGTQTVQPSQMSPHMMGVRSPYPQAGVMMPQGQGTPMMMRHQYPQGVMPLRRPSGSGPVPSPGSSVPIPSPSGPVQSPISGGMAMKPSPVHSGLKSPVPLASPSPGGPVASPVSGSMAMKPSPVHSGLRSPVPLASPQMQPHSSENPSTPLTPRSIGAGEIIGTPQTPHSDFGGPGSNNSQVNSPHPSIPTPTSDAVPSPVSSSSNSTPASLSSGTPAVQRSGGGGGNANNPNNPAPLPPYIRRFGYFKLGLKGGALLRSRWGHFKLGLKGGSPVGELENKRPSSTSCSEGAASPPTNATAIVSCTTSTIVTSTPTSVKSENEGDEDKEGLAHVLSESIKCPPVRMIGGTSRVGPVAYPTPTIATTSMPSHLSATANKLVVPEPAKSEIPPSSRHQAVIGIPGGGAIPSQNNMYPSHTVAVAPGIRIPSINASTNYPSLTTGAGSITTSTNMLNMPIGTSGTGSIASNLVPPSIMSVTSSATPVSSSYNPNVVPIGLHPDDVSTHSSIVSISDQVSGITSGLANFPSTASLPLSSVSAMTHTTPSLGRPLVSVPVQQIGSPQRPVLHNPAITTTTQQLRTLPSIGHLQPGTRPFRTQVMGAPVSQPGIQDSEGHHVVTQHQVMHPTLTQTVGMLTSNVHQPVGQQTWIQTSSGTLHQGGVVIQGGVQQAVGVRMVAQPMMVQQAVVRGSNVMVRPCTSGPVAVQGGVRMMMIHGQPVRTPSPPVTRPAMMPPPAAKSPAGHSASPVSRVSPAPSPLLNHPSPHSPQIKGHSPSMTSPAPSPLPTPPSSIKREPEDEHPGSCSTPNITHPIPVAASTPPALATQHMIVTGVSLQSVMNPQVTTHNSSGVSGQIKSEVVNDTMSKESSNALLKQLLENTGCASPMQQPSQGQLLLFRSSQGPVSVQSSHLSQVASQVPNPTPIVIPRSAVTSSGAVSHASVQQTTNTPSLMSQSNDMQQLQQQTQQQPQPQQQPQSQHGVITSGSQPQPLGSNSLMMQRSVVVSSGVHPSPQGTHTVILGQQQQLVTHSGTHVSLGHSVARPGVPFASQAHPVQFTSAPHASSQQGVVRQVTTHQVNHTGMIPSTVHHVIQGQPPHQTVSVSHSSHPVGSHPVTPAAPHMVVHPGVRATHPAQQHALGNVHQPGTHVITGPRTAPTPASMTDRVNSDPGLKTEMRVMIPETVMGTGTSTGEHTPEMTTPNEGSDSLDHEELKKAKKRAQQARRKSQSKDAKVQPAKRARQGSRVEEDYDAYIESVMQQLRAMPPLTIMEPDVPRNFNLCPVFGSGDLSKLGRRDYNHSQGILEGPEGNATLKNVTDYYNTQPFGDKMPIVTPAKTGPTQRGFYIHEFTPPKIGLPLDEYQEGDLVGGSSRSTPGQTPTREADSPDTVLSSSSPECILPESPLPFKGLKLVDMDDDPQEDQRDRSLSPAIPLLVPIPIRPGRLPFLSTQSKVSKDNPELDKENIGSLSSITMKSRVGQSPAMPLKDMGNVTVTLTLSSQAGEDVSGVLRSLANLLNIPSPSVYHLADRLAAPKIPRIYRHKQLKDGKEQVVDIQSILNGQARFCRHCDVIILNDMLCKKVLELPFLNKEEYGNVEEITFCSQQCYVQFAVSQRMLMDEKVKHEGTNRHVKVKDTIGDVKGSSLPPAEGLSDWSKNDDMDEVLKVPQLEDSLMSRPNKHKLLDDLNQYPKQADGKRFRGHKYKYWTLTALPLPENYEKPTPKEMTDLLFRMGITYRKPRLRDDSRQCILCNLYGDYVADGPSRLLNYDVDKWIHLNCALWAEDVYETMNGALMNVESAVKKVALSECEHCQQLGASVKCFKVRCSKVYHLNCAVKEGCTFYKNKTVYCQEHINKGEKDNELLTLAVFRRVFIDREENRQVASVMHHADLSYVLRIGSLILLAIGQLLPHQLQAFHTPYCIYPVGYQVIRYYWSMRRLHKRCAYECSIHDKEGQPEFRITVKEDDYEDRVFISCSPKGVWTKVLEPLAELRQKADVVRLFPQYISGEDLFGLTEPAIVRILESLPGIDTLADYNFKFGRNPLFELPLAVNPSGCARAEPFTKLHLKRYHGIRTSAGSVRTSSNCRAAASVANLTMAYDPFVPYSKLHVHSRSSQYKKMNNEWRSSVYLARSKIQGLGLYAARDIEKNTMIIEYIGEIIRSELAEVREKRYEAQNRGIYMFRLDDQRVVDATVTGGLARYINHSCGPNCYTETIEVERDMKILIISNRKILRGEELAYDYKFDEEEDHKIPCLCGADNCRKWMN